MTSRPASILIRKYTSPVIAYNADLTPRTPYSQVHVPDLDDEVDDSDLVLNQQSYPLLASSSPTRASAREKPQLSPGSPYESRNRALSRLSLGSRILGGAAALLLVLLGFIVYQRVQSYPSATSDPAKENLDAVPVVSKPTYSPGAIARPRPSSQSQSQPQPTHIVDAHRIDYSDYSMFPLEPLQYAAECWKMHQKPAPHPPYWEAGEHGVMDVAHDTSNPNVCSSTITYQLDGYVGLFADLALIAQVAALARERNRTLLIDDRYWNRGRWQDHFMSVRHTQPGPEPGCTPPPPEELVACPRLAKHWVVNSRTAKFHFSHGFDDQYHDAYSHGIDRLHPIFDMALTSLESTIIPNKFNSDLIRMARNEIGKPSYLAVHIRRGDRKPVSWKYRDGFVPLLDYLHGVEKAWQKINATSANKAIWLASDSVEAQRQFIDLLPAGVDTFGLSISSNPGLRSLQPSSAYRQVDWPSKAPSDRIQETRGVIVDFALLSGAWMPAAELGVWPEAVVCTISSNLCTLSAVPFGWELAFEKKLWVEIDNAGSIAPIWNAFELF